MNLIKNNNRNFIKTLSANCLKANKRRNAVAVLAIILTAVLFMALTTVLEGAQITEKNQRLRQAGTKLMVSIKNLTAEEAQRFASAPEFVVSAIERYAVNVTNPQFSHMQAVAGWVDETSAKYSFMELEEGHYPQAENEIACDTEVLRLLGLPKQTGVTFTLQYTAGTKQLEKQMTVCGFFQGMKYEQRTSLLVSKRSQIRQCASYDGIYASMKDSMYDVRGNFADEKNVEKQLDRLVERMGYDPDAERGEDGFIIHHVNPVYNISAQNSSDSYIMAGIGALLILTAGYLIIYNIFKISIEKDIRLYGQLKTVGTSPKQIRYMIVRQGMLLSIAGIPFGLVFGWLLGNALLPLIMANTSFQDTSFVFPSVWIWVLSGIFTFVTVRISCSRPGRIAGKISPVEALKFHGSSTGRKKNKKGGQSAHRLASMAAANLGRNKGKTALVILSISLSAILLNCVLNYSASMDQETYVRREIVSDLEIRSAGFLKPSQEDYTKTIPKEAADLFSQLDGVEAFARIYCHILPDDEQVTSYEDTGSVTRINGKETPDNIIEFDRSMMLYGMNEQACSSLKIIEGAIDYEKLCSGNYVVMAGLLNDRGEYEYESQVFHAGDLIELEINKTAKEYTVLAIAGLAQSQCMSYSKGGYESAVFAEPVFLEKFPAMNTPIHCLFDAKDGTFDSLNEQATDLASRNGLTVLTRLTAEEEFNEMQNTYSSSGIIVAVILGAIGILNLVNVILTGVIARQREFASMRSIGMTKKQLQKLIIYEGILYALFAGAAGILCSGILSVTLVKTLARDMWFMKYHFTVLPAAVVSIICIALAACISAGTHRLWNQGSIVEQLRDAE